MSEVKSVLEVFASETALDPATLTPDMPLKDLSITSLDMMNVLFSLEDKLGVVLELDEVSGLETLGDLIALVEGKVACVPTERTP